MFGVSPVKLRLSIGTLAGLTIVLVCRCVVLVGVSPVKLRLSIDTLAGLTIVFVGCCVVFLVSALSLLRLG